MVVFARLRLLLRGLSFRPRDAADVRARVAAANCRP